MLARGDSKVHSLVRTLSLSGAKTLFCSWLGCDEVITSGGVLFWHKCIGALDGFVADKKEFSLEYADPISFKARVPFLRIRKKIDPMMNIEAMKHIP